jgi:FKBP-type peptidyl-prolyl cis-trans isomerase
MNSVLKVSLLSGVVCMAGQVSAKDIELKTDSQKASYAIGQQIGHNMKEQNLEVDVDVLSESIKEAFAGKKERMTQEEMAQSLQKMQQTMVTKQKAEGEKFLTENKKKKGVITTKSGLQYEVVTEGKGPMPTDTSMVKVHYKGTFLDGKEFDSSYSRNEPAEFPVNGVIPGWTEALKLMKVGSEYNLTVPSALAYGERGNGRIPPNTVLKFNVKLLEIVKNDKKPEAAKPAAKPAAKK